MRQTLEHQHRLFDVDEALQDITSRRPAMTDIATSFALLQKARLDAQAALPDSPLLDGDPDLAGLPHGRPLLADFMESLATPAKTTAEHFRAAAKVILPQAAQAFPKLAPDLARLALLLDSPGKAPDEGVQLAASLLAAIAPAKARNTAESAGATMEELATRLGISSPALHMTATEGLLALLTHASARLLPQVDNDIWRRGYCPVCGGGPDSGILKEAKEDSEFLIAKAGQLWLHCSQCAALWRFPRMRCAACDCEDPQRLELLLAEGDPRSDAERVQLCHDCKSYLPTLNMVDRTDRINLEMLPISMLHLDILAQKRGFAPMAPSPWNTLT
ncbi:MAG: formate dehydrogenase accessory protein FdhE [Desulfovibrio sp.]|jgi:FdhE protein|nr:formate dehydrogenase accessory protein FdhE [Desulfovibrio sp.]